MDGLLMPLKVAEAWVMVTIHKLLVAIGMSDGPGPAWVLSIVGLTVAVRVLIMPLFVKQIRSSRGMQAMQPELRALQNKYKGKKDPASQERMREEMMALYRKHGTNPLSSCLPMLIQIPIFFALFRVLARLQEVANSAGSAHPVKIGPLTPALAADVQSSSLFGAPLSSSFMNSGSATVKIVTMVLIVLMTVTQFYTMHQLTMKNMPKSVTESDNPAMRTQRMMMYGMPLIFFITGPQFQVGVLIYWLVSNVWTMGQQWWTIRNMPAVGSEAYKKRLQCVRDELVKEISTLPENQRALVTCEGAFSYLAADAGLKEKYIWAVNSEQQATPSQISSAIDYVRENQVPAVFCESTVSDNPMRQVADATGARFGGVLYVDSLSEANGPVPTYLDMIRYDARTIVAGLKGNS